METPALQHEAYQQLSFSYTINTCTFNISNSKEKKDSPENARQEIGYKEVLYDVHVEKFISNFLLSGDQRGKKREVKKANTINALFSLLLTSIRPLLPLPSSQLLPSTTCGSQKHQHHVQQPNSTTSHEQLLHQLHNQRFDSSKGRHPPLKNKAALISALRNNFHNFF